MQFHEPLITEKQERKPERKPEKRPVGQADRSETTRRVSSEEGKEGERKNRPQSSGSERSGRRSTERSRPVPKEKSLDELRSTLRSIVGAQQSAKKGNTNPAGNVTAALQKETRPNAEKDEPHSKNDLKTALAGALDSNSPEQRQEAFASKHTAVPASLNDDSISPRELERMMRITTSDKPPLK